MSFSFGGSKSGGFSFGTPTTGASTGTTGSTGSTGFSFGAPASSTPAPAPAAAPAAGGFSFGATAAPNKPAAGFTLSSAPAPTAPAGGFSFGTTPAATSTTSATTAPKPGFSFGTPSGGAGTAAPSAGFSFSTPSTTTTTSTTAGFSLGGAGAASTGGGLTLGAGKPGGFSLGGSAGFSLSNPPSAGAATSAPSGGTGVLAGLLSTNTAATATTTTPLNKPGAAVQPSAAPTLNLTVGTAPAPQATGLGGTAPSTQTTGLGGTAAAPAKTGFSFGGATVGGASAAPATTTTSTATAGSSMTYGQLEESINKWTLELEEQESEFLRLATQVNAWDRLLIDNGEKITSLNDDVEKVKVDQQRLDHELDFIQAQQKELEEMLLPLEQAVDQLPAIGYHQHADLERERTYQLAETVDGQLKRMVSDLKEVIDHLNTSSSSTDTSDPLHQISRILNAHMDSLQWVDQNTALVHRKVEEISKLTELRRRDQERNFKLAYD